jgi:hypothetical protein
MASLALIVSVLFLSVLIIGPLSYILSLFDWMPKFFIWIMGLLCILVGGLTFALPVVFLKVLGLIDIAIGFKIISDRQQKKVVFDKTVCRWYT